MSDSGILLQLRLRPSWGLAALMAGAHALAALCVLAVSTSLAAVAMAGLVFALGAASAWDRALLRGRSSPRGLELTADGGLRVCLADGTRIAAEDGARMVHRRLVALILRNPKRSSVLVGGGMLDADAFRKLRIWALWGRLPGVAPAQLAR